MNPIQPAGPQPILRPDPPVAPKTPEPAHRPLGPAQPPAGQNPALTVRQNLVRLLAELDRILSSYSKQPARAYVALENLRKQEIFALTQPERLTDSRDIEEAKLIHLKFELFFRECANALSPAELEQARLCAAYLQDLMRASRGFQEFILEQAQSDPLERAKIRSAFVERIHSQNRGRRNLTIALTLLAILLCFLILPMGAAIAVAILLGAGSSGVYWAFLRQPLPAEDPEEDNGEEALPEEPALRGQLDVIRQVMGDEFARGARPYLLGSGGTMK